MCYPKCAGEVTVDISQLKEGDYAGISAFQGCYGLVALTKKDGKNYVVMSSREAEDDSLAAMERDDQEGTEWEQIPIENNVLRLRVEVDFTDMKDEAKFFFDDGKQWKKIGISHKLYFKMDHFTGCRFGLFVYSTKQIGGKEYFHEFEYEY